VGVTREHSMFCADVAVDAKIRLILVIGLRGGANVVIRSRDVRQRIVLENLETQLIEAARRNRVISKLSSRRSLRIENRLGEDALALSQGGHDAESCDSIAQPRSLPNHEEGRSVRRT